MKIVHVLRGVFLCLFTTLTMSCGNSSSISAVKPKDLFTAGNLKNNYKPYGYVAHALGSIDGEIYTNSREAFELSYRKGFRIFEVDLVLLKDGTVFAAHDNLEKNYGLDKTFAEATIDELSGKLYLGKYTPLTGSQLLSLFNEKKDAYLIIDTKYSHIEIVKTLVEIARKKYPSVLERIIPHIVGSYLRRWLKLIYPFKNYILALYRSNMSNSEVIQFVKNNHIKAVMMHWCKRYTYQFKEELSKVGAVTYVHSLKDPEKINLFKKQGVGVYSDGFIPK